VGIGDPEVRALLVGTSEALGVYSLRCSPTAFDLAPGAHRCRCRCWLHARRGSGDETTGGAIVWAARLEQTVERGALGPSSCGGRPKREPVKTPQQCQPEKETDHKQEHEHRKGHNDPRCLKWGEGELLEKQA
jgi:hypothetical protein